MKMIMTVTVVFASLLALSCSKAVTASGAKRYRESIVVDGISRSYIVRLPDRAADAPSLLPLVIGLHGTGGSAEQFETVYGFNAKADASGFIAVYADGVLKEDGLGLFEIRTWNAGTCCDYAMYKGIDDVKFISSLIDSLVRRFPVDPRRVYVTGMSNGAMMAYRLASELPGKIAAIAVVSGTMVAAKDPARAGAVPVLHIHARPDTKVPFAGGVGIGGVDFPPAMDGIRYWVNRNGCTADPIAEQYSGYELQSWKDPDGTVKVQLYLTDDGGHAWPSAPKQGRRGDTPSQVLRATDLIWDFFTKFQQP